MCSARTHVRYYPNSDRESGLRQAVCLLYPLKRTDAVQNEMAAMGQKLTFRTRFVLSAPDSGIQREPR